MDLCRRLETLADSLPLKVDTHAAILLADRMGKTLRRCHRLEEKIIFPAFLNANDDVQAILKRLRKEHLEDEDHARDVEDAIRAFVVLRKRESAEELGYMLRCLFVPLRRHLAFDRDYLLPLYHRVCKS